jgi:hypothetical protein
MKEINLQDMARMYKKEFSFLNKELSRLEKVVDKGDYKLTSRDEMILDIAHNLTNPPRTITNSQLAFLWNMDRRSTNRLTTDLLTKKLKKKAMPHKGLRPHGAFSDDPTHEYLPQEKEPDDIMESFYRLSGVPVEEISEESDKDYATARRVADNHDKGPVTAASARAWAKESGVGIENMDVVVKLANEILGYEGLDESKKRKFGVATLKKRAISLRRKVMDIVDQVYEMDELEGDHLNELLNDESFLRGAAGDYTRQETEEEESEEELDEEGAGGAGAATAGVPGAAKPGKGYTMVGAGTGGTGPSYKGGEKSKAKWPGMKEEELEEKKSPNSGTIAFHFTTSDGVPYFGEADVTISHDTDDARGPITTVETVRVKSIVDQQGNPVAITDEMKSAAKQAVGDIEDIELLISAGYEDDDYYGDDDLDEESLTDQQYLPKEGEPRGQVAPKPGSSGINEGEEAEGVMKTLATRKLYKNRPDEDPVKQFQRRDVWIPREKKSDIIAKFKDKVQTMLKEMELEGTGVETETEPAVKPETIPGKPGKTDKPVNPLKPTTPGITPKPKAEESANPDVQLFLKNRQTK